MRIAYFTECYYPTRNGVVVSVDTFARELRKLGHDVEIFAPSYPGFQRNREHVQGFPAVRFPVWRDYPLAFPWSWSGVRAFSQFRPDLVHAHSLFMLSRLGAYLARKAGVPLVMTYHTLITEYVHYVPLPSSLVRQALRRISRRYCNNCDLVITPTPEIVPVLRSYGVTRPIEPIPTGMDVERLSSGDGAGTRRALGLPANATVLLYVGRMAREKNVDFLLRTLMPLLRQREDCILLLVGGGPHIASLHHLARELELGPKARFVGFVAHDQVANYYAAADLFVFASQTETQGLVLAEAMAAGLPGVAVAARGVNAVAADGESGRLVPPDEEAFREAVQALLDSPESRRRMSEAARRRARDFSAEASARKMEAVYRELLS